MACGIYKIRNITNDKCYTGSSVNIDQRWEGHRRGLKKGKHSSIKLQRAWDKYGSEEFSFEVVEFLDENISEFDLLMYEQFWMDKLDSVENGYNVCPIAGRPPCSSTFSLESKYKMGVSFRGKTRPTCTEEHKQRLSEAVTGVPKQFESGVKNEARQKAWATKRERGTDKHSEQTKKLLSAIKTGKPNHKGRLMYTYQGETLSMIEWSERTGVKLSKIRGRVERNWPEDKVFLNDQDASVYKGERIAKGKKGKPNGLKGQKIGPRSEEAKANMSAAKKGKPLPWYTPEKMQEALQKSWATRRANGTDKHTEATKLKISLTKRSK